MYDSVYISIAIIQECAKYCMHGYSQSQNQNLPQYGLLSVSQMFQCVILEVIFILDEVWGWAQQTACGYYVLTMLYAEVYCVAKYVTGWPVAKQAWCPAVMYGGFVSDGQPPSLPKKCSLLEHQGSQFILYFTCIFKMYFWSCFTTLAVACKVPARPGQPGKTMTGKGIVKGIVNV